MKEIERLVDDYALQLLELRREHPRLQSILGRPDYVAAQAGNHQDYRLLLDSYQQESYEIIALDKSSKRSVATVELMGTLALQSFGTVDWLEVLPPVAGTPKTTPTTLDHAGFHYRRPMTASDALESINLEFDHFKDADDEWVEVIFGEGLKFQLHDQSKKEAVDLARLNKTAKVLWHKPTVADSKHTPMSKRSA